MKLYLAVNVDTCFMASMKMQLICCSKYTFIERFTIECRKLLRFCFISP